MATLKFGLLGCSSIAVKHATALRRISGAELTAVCDVNMERAQSIGRAFGVSFYGSLKEMTRKASFDIVCVLTPSALHARHGMEAARAGKHVIVEKPLAISLAEADELIDTCQRSGVRLFVVHQYRYGERLRQLSAARVEGRFGKMVLGTVRMRWRRTSSYYAAASWRGNTKQGGGLLFNQAVHFIDALQWIMGDVASVKATTATRSCETAGEDTAAAILRFRDGALGVIEATTAVGPSNLEGSISVLGEEGSVVIGGLAMDQLQTWSFRTPRPEDEAIFQTGSNAASESTDSGHRRLLEDVVSAVRSGREALVDGLEGRRCLRLILGMHEAASSGREIILQS